MASSTAIEECESSFASPCSQVGCLHSPMKTTKYTTHERAPTPDPNPSRRLHPTTAFSCFWSDSKPPQVSNPPPSNPHPGASPMKPENPAAHPPPPPPPPPPNSSRNDHKLWDRDPDKYALMKHIHHTGCEADSGFKVAISEIPVLITDLRPLEQNIAYEAIIARAPKRKFAGFYALQLSRLYEIRDAVTVETVGINRIVAVLRECAAGAGVAAVPVGSRRGLVPKESAATVTRRESLATVKCTESLAAGSIEGEGRSESGRYRERSSENESKSASDKTIQERIREYKESLKRRDKLKAIERGVMRLLDMCERVMAGEKGFPKVPWRRSASGS